MEAMEELGKIADAFLRTAKKILGYLVAEKIHLNSGREPPSNEGCPLSEKLDHRKKLWEFLTDQGVSVDRLERFAVGWIDNPQTMFQRLLEEGFSAEELKRSKLLADRRLAGRLIGPIQTPSGKIISFWARSVGSPQEGPKYLYWRPDWTAKVPAVWLPTALLRGGRKKGILVVEDIWDAFVLQIHGFLRSVALGESGQSILTKRLAHFARLGIRCLTIALNQTQDWPVRLACLREVFQPGREPFQLWVLPPDELGLYFSPAELVQKQGPKAFQKLLTNKRIAIESLRTPVPSQQSSSPRSSAQSTPSKELVSSIEEANIAEQIRPTGGFPKRCPLHQCLETDCFCFD
ncbi:MAG: hypothetical protein NZ602_03145 [Thermoguttaceae bacterium]|nr:hypothetical protein [Thermoguttaceae bacterium]MDW8037369.1 hypothetical protein [Thermoguttaceae bacterium]